MRVSALKDLAAIIRLSSLSNWENKERRTIVAISQRQKSPCPHRALGPNHTTPPRKQTGIFLRCNICNSTYIRQMPPAMSYRVIRV